MDIYFCDLCGVRVTDADLRAGHGIRSQWDVICGTCLELGHGKDWLSQRSKAKAAAASPTLDAARDRVATIDAGPDLPRVAARPIVAEAPETFEATPADAQPALTEADLTSTARVSSPARPDQPMQLAAAANMFSALQTPAAPARPTDAKGAVPASDDADDLTDGGLAGEIAPARSPSSLPDTPSPFAAAKGQEKDETVGFLPALPDSGEDTGDDLLPLDEAPKPAAKERPAGGTSSHRKPAGSTSRIGKGSAGRAAPGKPTPAKLSAANAPSAAKPSNPAKASSPAKPAPASKTTTGKSGKGKAGSKTTGRARRGGSADSSRKVLIFSVISLLVICIIFGVVMANKGGGKRAAATGVDEKEITAMIKDTEKQVIGALKSDKLPDLEAALASLNRTTAQIEVFERTAAKSGDGEEKVAGVLQRLRWEDTYGQSVSLRNRIQILKQQR